MAGYLDTLITEDGQQWSFQNLLDKGLLSIFLVKSFNFDADMLFLFKRVSAFE